jgi:hypothetical protein
VVVVVLVVVVAAAEAEFIVVAVVNVLTSCPYCFNIEIICGKVY